jgi:Kdo2-lipid IVA lauroyltransferase/acyltransferase
MTVLFQLLSWLPLSLLHAVGALAGRMAYALSPTYRRHVQENLALAGLSDPSLRRAAVAHAGRTLFELPKLWLRPQDEIIARVVRVTGWELADEAWRAGGGILFLTPHLGCFEITAQYCALHRPITVLYRRPKQAWLVQLVERGRGTNLKIAPADVSGVRTLMRALRKGEMVGMLPDQVPGNGEGVWAPFFGRPAYTMTLAARLAEHGATVLSIYAERLPHGAGYHVHVLKPPQALEGTLEARVGGVNAAIEAMIRRCPEQYLWGYNRYKRPSGAPAAAARSGE